MNNNRSRSSKAILIIVMIFGLTLLALGKLDSMANATVFALVYIGAIFNRLDSRHQGYKANITAAGVSASIESAGWQEEATILEAEMKGLPTSDDEAGGPAEGHGNA